MKRLLKNKASDSVSHYAVELEAEGMSPAAALAKAQPTYGEIRPAIEFVANHANVYSLKPLLLCDVAGAEIRGQGYRVQSALGGGLQLTCPQFRDITIGAEAADEVFFRATVPKYYQKMVSAFPNSDKLPGNAQGALLSLVFNRGTSMKGERRDEMREIRELLACDPPYDLEAIARELRKMKRLWEGKGLNGLVTRREREARLVERGDAIC